MRWETMTFKYKYSIDTVLKKTWTLGKILKHTSKEQPTDKLNQQHTVYKVPANALIIKLTLENPNVKWEQN